MVASGVGWEGGIDWKFGIDMYMVYLKQVINKDLL